VIDLYGNLPYIWPMDRDARGARLEARLSSDTHELIRRAAEIEGRTMTDFVVSAAQEAARGVVERDAVIRVSVEDQRRFAEALLKPRAPNPALKRAFKRHARLIRPA
jgi:uncharacterized protein (DUF1778 family)